MASLKILIDARMVVSNHGIARYTKDLISGLQEQNHEVSILYFDERTLEILDKNLLKNQIKCKFPFTHPLSTFELSFLIDYSPYDVIHFTSFDLPFRLPKKAVITMHDLIHLYKPAKIFHKIYFHTVVKTALQRAEKIIAVSQWTKNELVRILKVSPNKISVVRNGLTSFWFGNQVKEKSDEPYFIALGNTKPHKNLRLLIEACRLLWQQGETFKLYLSLGGEDLPKEWNVQNKNIILLKNISDEELRSKIALAKALVSPSFFEGFNYPVAEALALGTPVICSKTSANTEFEGDISFFSNLKDPRELSEHLKNHLNIKKMVPHNVSTIDVMTKTTSQVYSSSI